MCSQHQVSPENKLGVMPIYAELKFAFSRNPSPIGVTDPVERLFQKKISSIELKINAIHADQMRVREYRF